MPTPFFDTLRFAERLQSAGVPEPQARAEVEILRDIFAESLVTSLASKEDIRGVAPLRPSNAAPERVTARIDRVRAAPIIAPEWYKEQ